MNKKYLKKFSCISVQTEACYADFILNKGSDLMDKEHCLNASEQTAELLIHCPLPHITPTSRCSHLMSKLFVFPSFYFFFLQKYQPNSFKHVYGSL